MNDTIAGLLGVALIVGLFVAYAIQRRQRNRPAPPRAVEAPPTSAIGPEPRPQSSSPNWGMPIVYCLLLAAADSHRDSAWGYLWQGLFFAILAVAAYSTFSPAELATARARTPGTTRLHHYVTIGVPYLLFPATGWALVALFGWSPGALVPAIPWLLLLLAGGAVVLWQKIRPAKS